MEERTVQPQLAAVAEGAADDPAQHVAATLVGRNDPVGHQEGGGAQVVGNYPVGGGELVRGTVGTLHKLRHGIDDRREEVGFVVGLDPLQNHGEALEPGTGVDTRFRQWMQLALGVTVELHEDQVPDLDDVVTLAVDQLGAAGRHGVRTAVVVDLRARSAGAGLSHRPIVVLLVESKYPIRRCTDLFPQLGGVIVIGVNGEPQPIDGQAIDVDHQLPRELDRLLFEIVAKRKVAEHLEEGVVTGRVANVFEVIVFAARANALLG